MSARARNVGIAVAALVLVAVVAVAALLIRKDTGAGEEEADWIPSEERIPADVPLDDPNREAYYIEDLYSFADLTDPDDPEVDQEFIDLGHLVCDMLGEGFTFEEIALVVEEGTGHTMFSIGIVGAASVWLCPEHIEE